MVRSHRRTAGGLRRRGRCAAAGALVATVALGASLLATAPSGAVPVNQNYFVPHSRQLALTGHGYGHGIGMSQYGAQGAARQGRSYQQILDFYYPGTTLGSRSGQIRVLITADSTSDVKVSPTTGLLVRDVVTRQQWVLPTDPAITRWRITPSPDRVEFYKNGSWTTYRRLDHDAEFDAQTPITLWVPSGSGEVGRQYRDRLRYASVAGSNSHDTVNVLGMELYLQGVVAREMPASWSAEALKAQSVAARTYAQRIMDSENHGHYDICDTTSCQVYGGVGAEDSRSTAAVQATAGKVLRYGGSAAFTQFSSSSGGYTAAGAFPYLKAQPDPWDDWSGNPVHTWTTTVNAAALENRYPALGRLIRIRVTDRTGNGQWGGRIRQVVLDGTSGDVTLSGSDLRFVLGLRSEWFAARRTPIEVRWTAMGGGSSRVGNPIGAEYSVLGGRGAGQVFARGRMYSSSSSGAHEVYGDILHRYLAIGGSGSRVSLPTSGVQDAAAPGSRRQLFERGRFYWTKATGGWEVYGDILHRYLRIGGTGSRVGAPISGVQDAAAPGSRRQLFDRGRFYWTKATGGWEVYGDILLRYLRIGGTGSRVGAPISGVQDAAAPGSRRQLFERGRFYWTKATGGWEVYGDILHRYLRIGGTGSRVGAPTSGVQDAERSGTRQQLFAGGRMYWSRATGGWEVYGANLDLFRATGGTAGRLDLPVSGVFDGALPGLRRQDFVQGRIYWSRALGSRDVSGRIVDRYISLGAETSALGAPTTGQYDVNADVVANDFQHGRITWNHRTGVVRVTYS